jgi:hypothetical protein
MYFYALVVTYFTPSELFSIITNMNMRSISTEIMHLLNRRTIYHLNNSTTPLIENDDYSQLTIRIL